MRIPLVGMLSALALAGCASVPASKITAGRAEAPINRAAGAIYGTIVAAHRPAPSGRTGSDTIDAEILTAVGEARDPLPDGGTNNDTEREFIVREDDGRTVSVMQGDQPYLTPGQRVLVVRGNETRILPLR